LLSVFYQFSGITAYYGNDAQFLRNRGMTGSSSFVSDYGSCFFMIGPNQDLSNR
jgi:hypothetical protein